MPDRRRAARRPKMKYITAVVLVCLQAVFVSCAAPANVGGEKAELVSVTEVAPTGLLEEFDLPPETIAFEIMPEAENIVTITIEYYGGAGPEYLGQLVLEKEDGGAFTRQDTLRRAFRIADADLLENFTLVFSFTDENGTEHRAVNDYALPQAHYGEKRFIKIEGSRTDGYRLTDH